MGCRVSEQPVYLPSARRPHPGRPRKAEYGHVTGTSDAEALENKGPEIGTVALEANAPLLPRLLDVHGAALYLSLPGASVYDLAARDVLQRVRIPLPAGGELRKLLFDRADLDRLVEAWKDRA